MGSLRTPYPLLCILALAAPPTAGAQGAPRPMPYEDVLEFALLESPDRVLRDVSTGNRCFDFDLTPERQQELRAAAQRRDPYAQPTVLDPVFAYIQSRPCRPPRPSPPPRSPPFRHCTRSTTAIRSWGSSGTRTCFLRGRGSACRREDGRRGRWTRSSSHATAPTMAGPSRVSQLHGSPWQGNYHCAGGCSPTRPRWRSTFRAVSPGRQSGGSRESYLGRYAGVGVTGGGGVGLFVTSRILLSIDYQGQRLWSVNDDEQGFTGQADGGFQASLIRLGITRFW